MTALTELLAKVEAGWPPDIDTPYMPPFHAVWNDWRAQDAWLANNGSLDAAKDLHDAVLPGWWCDLRVSTRPRAIIGYTTESFEGQCDNPARAWLIAILRALIAQEAADGKEQE